MTYYIHWIDEKLEVEPNLKGSPEAIEAPNPREAWEKFYARHPTLRDGEGDYYVTVRTSRIPKDDESDIVAEAGVNKDTGLSYFELEHDIFVVNEW